MYLERKDYKSGEFWNGGEVIQVNNGVVELVEDCDISRNYAILLSHGFHVVTLPGQEPRPLPSIDVKPEPIAEPTPEQPKEITIESKKKD